MCLCTDAYPPYVMLRGGDGVETAAELPLIAPLDAPAQDEAVPRAAWGSGAMTTVHVESAFWRTSGLCQGVSAQSEMSRPSGADETPWAACGDRVGCKTWTCSPRHFDIMDGLP